MRATVIVDTQNAYGSSGDALGQRGKPDPAGVVLAFGAIGYEVVEIRVAVALPDAQDCRQASSALAGQGRGIQRLADDIRGLAMPSMARADWQTCLRNLANATALVTSSSQPTGPIRSQLSQLNKAAADALAQLEPAGRLLESLVRQLDDLARLSAGSVPAEWVTGMRVLAEGTRRLQVLRTAVQSASSFAYAGAANLDYHGSLPASVGPVGVRVMEGRFRPGRDGQTPGEKQVDTLCAVACVEATTRALAVGEPHSVIVLSDDDDLTPAVSHAAELAHGSSVRVVVAGSSTVASRHGGIPPSPKRPGWLTMDSSMWCCLVGETPSRIHAQRNQLGALALGGTAAFTVTGESASTRLGLKAKLDRRDAGLSGQVALSAVSLSWGSGRGRPIPTAVVGSAGGAIRDVVRARARRAQGSRLSPRQMPLDVGGVPGEAVLGAPGWWMAGDELVVASVLVRGRTMYRVLGHAPGFVLQRPPSVATRAEVARVSGEWAEVSGEAGACWSIYAPTAIGLSPGDQVLVWPYELNGQVGPGGRRYHPRAVLLSSAL